MDAKRCGRLRVRAELPGRIRAPRFRRTARLHAHIVCAAAQLNVGGGRGTACGIRLDVVKLEESAFGAAPAPSHERTPPFVAPPHLALHGGRDVPRAAGRTSRAAWRRCRGTSTTFQILQQQGQGAIEDLGEIAARDRVPGQGLHAAQLVMGLSRDRELDLVALRRERRHRGPRGRYRAGLGPDRRDLHSRRDRNGGAQIHRGAGLRQLPDDCGCVRLRTEGRD
jgi:hypothetical protein